jgi:flagellar motor protein MotB
MARKKKHEEHVNAEAWAIPYGDLVTLLFALFTVMYAMSSVNEGKFRVLSDSMIAAFNGAPKTLRPVNLGEKEARRREAAGHYAHGTGSRWTKVHAGRAWCRAIRPDREPPLADLPGA